MKCPKCQFENPEEAKFCIKCGKPMEFHCPKCGAKTPVIGDFCMECGHNLTVPSEPPPKELSFDEKIDKIQRYLPKGLTEKILSQRDRIEGERKQVTVMFCDMEGYSQLSERLGPEEAYGIMDQVYEILIHKVHDFDGTVNEMTGDGIMALFGAPIALEDAPQRAIRSAMAIHREMARFSDKIKEEREAIPPLKMRVGIHTGPVVVGTLGNDLRVEFKAVGETVNLASRMEGLAEPGATYVTEETFKLTEGFFRFEALGEKKVKGKKERVNVYRVIAPSTRRTRFDVSAERGLTPFVGRERELELLLDGFERAKAGRGQALSIMAEAGIGKSRLLYEFRKAVSNEDVTFLEGKCLSYSRGEAYHPLVDILKSNFDIQESDGDLKIREKVQKGLQMLEADETFTLPYLLELLSVKDSGIDELSLSPEVRKDRIIAALIQIVLKGSEIRPLVLAYEDLHWMDKSSEESLKSLLDSIAGARVFLIFTYRPEYVHTWGGKSYHSQVNLNRLSNRESLVMVTHLLDTEQLESSLEDFILEKTEGIPFFIEEFIKSLKNLKVIKRKENTYRIAKDIQTMTIPVTIHDLIMSRVDSLPDRGKGVLQTGSVAGREFSHDLIKRVTDQSEPELLSHLSGLKDAELLYERGIYPKSTYIFKHALTQETVYDSLLLKTRKEVHEKIGGAIEEVYSERLEEFYEMLAYHYSKSDNSEIAYRYLKLSGDKATRNHSVWEAFNFFRKAIEKLRQFPETDENKREQIEAIRLAEMPMRLLGYPEDSLTILQEGESLSKELGDARVIARFYNAIGLYHSARGDPSLATKYQENCFEQADKAQDIELMAQSARGLCLTYAFSGKLTKALDIAPKVTNLLEKTQRQSEFFGTPICIYALLQATHGLSTGAAVGAFQQGENLLEKALSFSVELDEPFTLGSVEYNYGLLYALKGDGENTIKHCENTISHYERAGATLLLGQAWSTVGYGYYLLGELESALNHIKEGLKIQKGVGTLIWLSSHYLYQGIVHFRLGDLEQAQRLIEEALKLSQKNKDRFFEGMSKIWLGRIMVRADMRKADHGEKSILHGIRIFSDLKLKPRCAEGYLLLGELYADVGRAAEARENLEKAERMFREMEMDYWLAWTQEVLGRL
jgi:class 3 adenylate cyclase/tetratricopeptide (TPR) repeat protein